MGESKMTMRQPSFNNTDDLTEVKCYRAEIAGKRTNKGENLELSGS
jgi:hypothetical protein